MELASTFALAHASAMTRTGFTQVHAADDASSSSRRATATKWHSLIFIGAPPGWCTVYYSRMPLTEVDDLGC